jgi:hypothetical protein
MNSIQDRQALQREHAALLAAYGQAQSHCSRLITAQAARILHLEAEAMRLRAAVIMRDTALAWAREDRQALEGSIPALTAAAMRQKSVLCVGEDAMALMLTRKVVEMAGGRYLGHSGDEDIDGHTLEASLVAADLVICQTGCVSHGAYWRVQDHCTRTGKQCVLVDKPEALGALPVETGQER